MGKQLAFNIFEANSQALSRFDMTGQRFGRLVALRSAGKNAQGLLLWLCRCDCGNEKAVLGYLLRKAKGTRSCGCLARETAAELMRKMAPDSPDLSGQRFGKLVALRRSAASKDAGVWWDCVCDCGREKRVRGALLTFKEGTRSCGCLRQEAATRRFAGTLIDLTGRRFERLLVLARTRTQNEPGRKFKIWWLCRCDCGIEKEITGDDLRSERTLSCGCWSRDFAHLHARKHGQARTKHRVPEYTIWQGMRSRCGNPKNVSYRRYGGRGITVCARWRESFEAFREDVSPRPTMRHTLDRIDNDGGYWCGKCDECLAAGRARNWRWATSAEQARNTSRSRLITAFGETLLMSDWTRRFGIHAFTIDLRLKKGYSPERAVSEPSRSTRKRPVMPPCRDTPAPPQTCVLATVSCSFRV